MVRDWNSEDIDASTYVIEGKAWAQDAVPLPDSRQKHIVIHGGAIALELFDRVGRPSGPFKARDLRGFLKTTARLSRKYEADLISHTLAWLCLQPAMEFDDGRPPLPLCRKLGYGVYDLPE